MSLFILLSSAASHSKVSPYFSGIFVDVGLILIRLMVRALVVSVSPYLPRQLSVVDSCRISCLMTRRLHISITS